MYLAVFGMYYNVLRCIEKTGPDTRQEPMYEAVLDVPIHTACVSIHAGWFQRHYSHIHAKSHVFVAFKVFCRFGKTGGEMWMYFGCISVYCACIGCLMMY
jgi:hypothetical protein